MALGATIFKVNLQIADMDSHYYQTHALTVARHPSETDERLMVRLLAFMLYASDSLTFGKGLSDGNEPALWQKDLTGAIELWLEVGLPDARELRKACGRAQQVALISYGRGADIWWKQNREALLRLKNLTVLNLLPNDTLALAKLASRSLDMQCTIQDELVMITAEGGSAQLEPISFLRPD